MSNLICKNTMRACQTPGMCAPHGGCKPAAGQLVHPDDHAKLRSDYATLEAENAKLRAELERRAVPDGWKLVPVEPTHEMIDAANSARGWAESDSLSRGCYRAMLAAAPSAPKADDPVKVQLLEALNGMLLHIREPESESEFQWPEHFKKQKAAFVAARAAIAAARQEGGK